MALLLQIADLHLGPLGPSQYVGDNKDKFIPVPERQNRLLILRGSLRSLAANLTVSGRQLDGVIVAGDISSRYSDEGFTILAEVLQELGNQYPGPERVLVVPGNHDVEWTTPASSEQRYALFRRHVRGANFLTPYLEGVDIDENGTALATSGAQPLLILDDGAVIVAAMNSTNYSGAVEPIGLTDDEQAEFTAKAGSELLLGKVWAELQRLQLRDAARVSPAQLVALSRCFAGDGAGGSVRAVVLHHHLLPVSASEEVKAYESLSNLGEVREFLSTNRINLVMHGHKHVAKAYLDLTHDVEEVGVGRMEFVQRPPVLVSSVANVGQQLGLGAEVARLVEISTEYPRARRVSVFSVHGLPAGSSYGDASFPRIATTIVTPPQAPPAVHTIEGATVDDVYDQLLAIFDDANAPAAALRSVVCRIADGRSALIPPESYALVFNEPPEIWFTEVVDWWQDPQPILIPPQFNHGARIFKGFGETNQLESVTEALEADPSTTRGVIMLIDPSTDDIGNTRLRVPAFCFAHFVIDRDTRRLDCLGYFRKQQMRVWWPINCAELARLQQQILERLRDRGRDYVAGAITTVSAEAIAGTARPRVLVPWIDRIAADKGPQIWELALDLYDSAIPCQDVLSKWTRIFSDWLPVGAKEPDGVPLSLTGLAALEQAVRVIARREESGRGSELADRLSSLHYDNERYSESEDLPRADASERDLAYDKWVRQVTREYDTIMTLIADITKRDVES